MRVLLSLLFLIALGGAAIAAPLTPEQRIADLNWLVAQLEKSYAYRQKRHVDIAAIARLYRDDALKADDEFKWIALLERITAELYDHHISLNTNTDISPQLVPSGTDIWAEIIAGRPTITQVRQRSAAHRAGVRAGMTVTAINNEPVAQAIARWRPRALTKPDGEADAFALRLLLAGNHSDRRKFVACSNVCQPFDLPPAEGWRADARVAFETIDGDIGYIRIDNSLGDTNTIADVDRALEQLKGTKGLILDLRNTPSGGNTDTAEPILGRFIARRTGYQTVEDQRRGRWTKEVDPRAPLVTQPLVVLVNRWTGSMGEGMAIGLDGMGRATIVGTKMAGLLGGIDPFTLPNSGIAVRFPIERLFHINGTPREDFVPARNVDMTRKDIADPILAAGIKELSNKVQR